MLKVTVTSEKEPEVSLLIGSLPVGGIGFDREGCKHSGE